MVDFIESFREIEEVGAYLFVIRQRLKSLTVIMS